MKKLIIGGVLAVTGTTIGLLPDPADTKMKQYKDTAGSIAMFVGGAVLANAIFDIENKTTRKLVMGSTLAVGGLIFPQGRSTFDIVNEYKTEIATAITLAGGAVITSGVVNLIEQKRDKGQQYKS